MRIMTYSLTSPNGLIRVIEADEYSSQHLIFCIPIEQYEAKRLKKFIDLIYFFKKGISAKIIENGLIKTVSLQLYAEAVANSEDSLPKFNTRVSGQNVSFDISPINFKNNNFEDNLAINYFYSGVNEVQLSSKRFIILEPDWNVLDQLFLEENILFTDWNQ